MRTGAKKAKSRVTRGDVFVNKTTKEVVRVMKSSKEHTHFGCLTGTITVRPFEPGAGDMEMLYTLQTTSANDTTMREHDYAYVRPSNIIVTRGELSSSNGLMVGLDVDHAIACAAEVECPNDAYRDDNAAADESNLSFILGGIPMFADELPLVEQAMVDYGNRIEKSPIVHPEIAGRGVEYAHGRAAFFYASRCQGKLAEMEELVYRAYDKKNIPQELAAKFERRTNDYQRSYRMGVLSKDLEKMREEIKTHRNMMDYHATFIKSEVADDDTDHHILNHVALSKILPQKMIAIRPADDPTITEAIFHVENCIALPFPHLAHGPPPIICTY
jgi:hypothetical protein